MCERVKLVSMLKTMFFLVAFICLNLCTKVHAQRRDIPSFKLLQESCGASCGTGQCTSALFTSKKSQDHRNEENNNLVFLHTGAILHPNAVLSVLTMSPDRLHFVDEQGELINKIFVRAGTNSTGHVSTESSQTQIREVDYVIPYTNSPSKLNTLLVWLHLRTPMDIPSANCICLPLTAVYPSLLDENQIAFRSVRGFALKESISKLHKDPDQFLQFMQYGSPAECEERFKESLKEGNFNQLYCGWEWTRASNGACAPLGSNDNFLHMGRMFLQGIAALVPGGACSQASTLFFYDLLSSETGLQTWMTNSMKCAFTSQFSCPSGECIEFEQVCNGRTDCRDGTGFDENPKMCSYGNSLQASNRKNYSSRKPDQLVNPEGTRRSSTLGRKTPGKACAVQLSPGVFSRCTNEGLEIDCRATAVGTKLELHCKPFYVSNTRSTSGEMVCGEDGLWTPFRPFSCKAVCGRLESNTERASVRPYIVNGMPTTKTYAFPWYAAIFVWIESKGSFEYICGASLIETSVVMTAAHCVIITGGRKRDTNDFRVVLAPTSSVFEDNKEEAGSKILKVVTFWVPRTYDSFRLSSDIALVRLDDTVEYTEIIQPVCYLPLETRALTPGSVGLVAGFGKDETNRISEKLRWAAFQSVSNNNCGKSLGIQIEANQFCAGFQNGTVACEGDSGSGIVFKQYSTSETSPYVLRGIVSKGLVAAGECVVDSVNVFTFVDSFGAWILDTLSGNNVF